MDRGTVSKYIRARYRLIGMSAVDNITPTRVPVSPSLCSVRNNGRIIDILGIIIPANSINHSARLPPKS